MIPENSRNFWNLPKAIPAYVTAKFERRIKGSGIQESILSEIPFPENVEGPKVVNGHLKELFLESRKNKEMDRKKNTKNPKKKVCKRCKICSKLTKNTTGVVLLSLLLTLKIFHTLL